MPVDLGEASSVAAAPDLARRTVDRVMLALVVAGALERVLSLPGARHDRVGGEAGNVARAFARTGRIEDVFARGSGLTAHLNPFVPAVAGGVYRILGVETPAAEITLSLVSTACVLLAAWLFARSLMMIGAAPRGMLAGLAVFCLVPLNKYLEIVDFRAWEGGLAVLLAATTLWLTVRADARGEVRWRAGLWVALLAACTFFVSPPLGLACYGNALILLMRRVPARRWAGMAAMATLVLVAVLTPWTVRNYLAFGRLIPLRSNFGLELALGNHAAAVSGAREHEVFLARLNEIHPQMSQRAFETMRRAGGEIAYADTLGARAKRWIAANPAGFVRLGVRHLREFYFPPDWQLVIYGGTASVGQKARLAAIWLVSLLGLLGAAAAALSWRGRFYYLVTLALIPALPYVVTQPVPRYRYLVFLPLLALGTELVNRLVARRRFGEHGR